jgi:acyl carrier protein
MMERRELRRVLQEMLENELGGPVENVDDSLALREGLGLDSVALINLVMQIQDRCNVFLKDEEVVNINRVGDLLDLLQSKMRALPKAG